MTIRAAFQPRYGKGITGTATTTSASATLDGGVTTNGGGSKAVVISNYDTTNILYVKIGAGTQVATAADYPIFPRSKETIAKSETDDTIGTLAAAATIAWHAIVGEGQ